MEKEVEDTRSARISPKSILMEYDRLLISLQGQNLSLEDAKITASAQLKEKYSQHDF